MRQLPMKTDTLPSHVLADARRCHKDMSRITSVTGKSWGADAGRSRAEQRVENPIALPSRLPMEQREKQLRAKQTDGRGVG